MVVLFKRLRLAPITTSTVVHTCLCCLQSISGHRTGLWHACQHACWDLTSISTTGHVQPRMWKRGCTYRCPVIACMLTGQLSPSTGTAAGDRAWYCSVLTGCRDRPQFSRRHQPTFIDSTKMLVTAVASCFFASSSSIVLTTMDVNGILRCC